MAEPRSLEVVRVVESRLLSIRKANGYATDAGAAGIHIGGFLLDEGELPALSILENPGDTPASAQVDSGAVVRETIEIAVQGLIRATSDAQPTVDAHQLLADIKRAVMVLGCGPAGDTLGGLASEFEYTGRFIRQREPGSNVAECIAFFRVTFVEPYGKPYGDPTGENP